MPDAGPVLVAGGGIGGLTVARALQLRGIPVRVYERAPELREVGAAITLWSNAVKVLRRLGLEEAIAAEAQVIQRGGFRSWRGQTLVVTPVGEIGQRLGAPNYCTTRAHLQRVLADSLEPGTLQLGAECIAVDQSPDGVRMTLHDGRTVDGSLLIGADGLHSVVRSELWGDMPPRYSGSGTWRALVDFSDPSLPLGHGFEALGPGLRFGMIQMAPRRAYIFAETLAPQDWRSDDSKAWLTERFARWHQPIPAVIATIDPDALFYTPIYDRPPLRQWSRGRITLLGDAAHPSTPHLGQGACLAIEDAWVLTRLLQEHVEPEVALQRYETARKRRTAAIVTGSRRLGWIGQQPLRLACEVRDFCMRWTPPAIMRQAFESSVKWDPPPD